MYGDGAVGIFADVEKALENGIRGRAAVDKEEVVVVKAGILFKSMFSIEAYSIKALSRLG